jgi:hypothetical protein
VIAYFQKLGIGRSALREHLQKMCLCKEEFPPQYKCQESVEKKAAAPRFLQWWKNFATSREEATGHKHLSKDDYEKLVAA